LAVEVVPVIPTTEQAPPPSVEPENKIIAEAAKQLSELSDFSDDFSDLLNPPPIDVSQLPVISIGDEAKDGDDV
jgi:hypothetical protein